MIQPFEMKALRPMRLHNGVVSTTSAVWNMLVASRDGDLDRVKELAERCSALVTCQHDYVAPLHLAVLEGHLELVCYLVERKALDPTYRNYPILEPLVTLAEDRGYGEIAVVLKRTLDNPELTCEWGDTGAIERGQNETQRRFQDLVDKSKHAEVEAMLKQSPELALDQDAFWGEGILAMPAKGADREMLELLMRYGARVPDLSKWGDRYYFKDYNTAAFLMQSGMNPNHVNWRRSTLLHLMAFRDDLRKAKLLLDHGADINAIDDEYQSTPLGYAAHFGRRELVALLLERGAHPNKSGAPWATPMAWARKRGHAEIESDLCQAQRGSG
jgi:ankyrin repeat protein